MGPFELREVPVLTCPGCMLLLGQSTLSKFDMNSTRASGLEFLTLTPRFPAWTTINRN